MASGLFLGWAIVIWIAALLSHVLGFSGAAASAFYIANVLGVISLSLAVLFVILRLATKPRPVFHQDSLSESRLKRLAGRIRHWLRVVP
ncbi:MAG: DUF1328 domain-containing protein [Bythopirellula sp.]